MSSSPVESKDTQPQEETNGEVLFKTPKNDLGKKCEKLKGTSLYLRFPSDLPSDDDDLEKMVKPLCDKIINVRAKKQKNRRWCLVEFSNPEEKQEAVKILKKVEIDGEKLKFLSSKTDVNEFMELPLELRKRITEKSKVKKFKKTYSNSPTIMVKNMPKTASLADVKEKFPDAVKIMLYFSNINEDSAVAIITFPTPEAAAKARNEKTNFQFGENTVQICYARPKGVFSQEKYGDKLKQNPLLIKKPKTDQSDEQDEDIVKKHAENEEQFVTKKDQKQKLQNKETTQNTILNPKPEEIKKKEKRVKLKPLESGQFDIYLNPTVEKDLKNEIQKRKNK